MSSFEFVNHESYPEDQYIAESVTICLDNKHRVIFVRKKTQKGGMFWDVISASVTHHGEKKYLKAYSQDSNFLREDIMHFLDTRAWEARSAIPAKSEEQIEMPF